MKTDLEEELAEEVVNAETETAKPQATSALLGKVIRASDVTIDPKTFKWKAFLAGPSGSGKTMAAMTLPGKKLLVDCDGRAETVAGMPDIDIYPCHEVDPRRPVAWTKADNLRKVIIHEVSRGIFPYDSVVWDGLTMLGRSCLNWALTLDPGRGLGGSPSRQHYGPQMDNLAKFVISTIFLPINVLYTGHVELLEDDQMGAHRLLPKITGKLRTEVSNWFNETYRAYRTRDEKGVLKYYWQTAGSGAHEFFKSSLNQLGRYWQDPIEINFNEPKVGFADLFERRFSGRAALKEAKDG